MTVPDLPATLSGAKSALMATELLLSHAREAVREPLLSNGRIDGERAENNQRATHGLAWLATYVQAIRELVAYLERAEADGACGELEANVTFLAISEYAAQCFGGIPMSQGEIVRPHDMGVAHELAQGFLTPEARAFHRSS